LRAVLLVDQPLFDPGDPNFSRRRWPRYAAAEYSVSHALRSLGHEVIGVATTTDVAGTINSITAARPHFVFNMVEEIGGRREYDGLIVQALEVLRIPFTGASFETLVLARNKHLSKLVVADAGVPVPKGTIITRDMKFSEEELIFPAILKPAYMDGSDGITTKSYVRNAAALRRRLSEFRRWLPLVCEEYIRGREIILTLSGTKTVTVDSICEMFFPDRSPVKFATDRAKFDAAYRKRFGIVYKTPTRLPPEMESKVVSAARKAYAALRINSYAKIEFRVDGERAVFIEANPNSQLSRDAKSTDFGSIGYEKFIRKVVRMARGRAADG
jgi:D-alanine-D-alanine ligase